jgi:ATP synthase protein I
MKADENKKQPDVFSQQIAAKEKIKMKALRSGSSVWFGLGMMGMVGWSVVVPSLLGVLGGIWLDKKYPQSFSWTLTLLIAGLVTGSTIAWYWVDKENKEMHKDKEQQDE